MQLYRSNIDSKSDPFGGRLAKAFDPPKIVVPKIPKLSEKKPEIPENERIYVMGVLPPDACILKKGSQIMTAVAGSKSPLGSVGEVTSEGAYVDGKFYKMSVYSSSAKPGKGVSVHDIYGTSEELMEEAARAGSGEEP